MFWSGKSHIFFCLGVERRIFDLRLDENPKVILDLKKVDKKRKLSLNH